MTTACLFEKNHLEIKLFKGEEERETQRETEREERERERGGEGGRILLQYPIGTQHTRYLYYL